MSIQPAFTKRLKTFFETYRYQRKDTEKITIEDGKNQVDAIVAFLQGSDDFTTNEIGNALAKLDFLPALCAIDSGSPSQKQVQLYRCEVASHVARQGFAALFLKIATSLVIYISPEKFDEKYGQIMYNMYLLLRNFMNMSDDCPRIAQEFGINGGVEVLLRLMDTLDGEINLSGTKITDRRFENLNDLLRLAFGIVHNCCRHSNNNRHIYRQANAVSLFESKSRSSSIHTRINSVLILAHIADERVAERITSSLDCILLLVELLRRAVLSSTHMVRVADERGVGTQYSAQELVNALYHLAVNDDNKVSIQKYGGIPILLRMLLDDFTEGDHVEALSLVWQLILVESIRGDEHIQDAVEVCKQLVIETNNSLVRETGSFILWTLSGFQMNFFSLLELPGLDNAPFLMYCKTSSIPIMTEASRLRGPCIIISCHYRDYQAMVRAMFIKDKLVQGGYNVWMKDYDFQKGQIFPASKVVEMARSTQVVLMCLTEEYKESPNCRAGMSYLTKHGLPVIPLLMDSKYQPDGWVEKLLGTDAKYLKFYTDEDMDRNIEGLMAIIGNRGKQMSGLGNRIKSAMKMIRRRNPGTTHSDSSKSPIRHNGEDTSRFRYVLENNVQYWVPERVQVWLEENGLPELIIPPEDFIGINPLKYWYDAYRTTPVDRFCNDMKASCNVSDDVTIQKFISALRKLFER